MEFGKVTNGTQMLVKGHPCKITGVSRSSPGKHGHAKKTLVGVDLITGKKYEGVITQHSHLVEVTSQKTTYTGLDFSDTYLSLMDESGLTREDLQLSEDDPLWVEAQNAVDEGLEFEVVVLRVQYYQDEDIVLEKVVEIKK